MHCVRFLWPQSVWIPAVAGITLALASARYEDENSMFPKGRGRFETCPYDPHPPIFIAMAIGAPQNGLDTPETAAYGYWLR